MPNDNIVDALQKIASQLTQFRIEMEVRFSNVTDDIKNLDKKVDKLRDGQAFQAGEIEGTQQQAIINKKKLGGSPMKSRENGARFGDSLKIE